MFAITPQKTAKRLLKITVKHPQDNPGLWEQGPRLPNPWVPGAELSTSHRQVALGAKPVETRSRRNGALEVLREDPGEFPLVRLARIRFIRQ